jgi:hypothetical protein
MHIPGAGGEIRKLALIISTKEMAEKKILLIIFRITELAMTDTI